MNQAAKDAVELIDGLEHICKLITDDPWQIEERFHKDDELEIIGGIDGDANDDGSLRMICTHIARFYDYEDAGADSISNRHFVVWLRKFDRKGVKAI